MLSIVDTFVAIVSIPSSRGQVLQGQKLAENIGRVKVSIPSSRGQVLQAEAGRRGWCPGPEFQSPQVGDRSCKRIQSLVPLNVWEVSIPSSRGQVLQEPEGWRAGRGGKFQSPQVGDRSCKMYDLYLAVTIDKFQSPQVGDRSCKKKSSTRPSASWTVSIPSSRGQVLQATLPDGDVEIVVSSFNPLKSGTGPASTRP